jgi:hypothetical protein
LKTFEQLYKEKFRVQLENILTDRNIYVSNDLKYKPLETDATGVVVVIKTGPGTRSSIAGYDLTTLTFNVNLVTQANALQTVLGALNNLIANYNGVWDSVTIPIFDAATGVTTDTTFTFKPVFTTPFQLSGVFDLKISNETMKAVTILMSVTTSYSSNAAAIPETYKLEIDGDMYDLNYISVESTVNPTYDGYPVDGTSEITKKLVAHVTTFNFTILKAKYGLDALHDLLHDECFKRSIYMLSGKTLKLYRGTAGLSADIQTYTISEVSENGSTVINLTLSR